MISFLKVFENISLWKTCIMQKKIKNQIAIHNSGETKPHSEARVYQENSR